MKAFERRGAGILLHPTSLPGPWGIGSLGREAFDWIDRLHAAGVSLWQVLPLGPTGFGYSPYQSDSAFAGDPLLIDPPESSPPSPIPENGRADYKRGEKAKSMSLRQAFERFADVAMPDDFEKFCAEEGEWLDDYALFAALKEHFDGKPWWEWDAPCRRREAKTLRRVSKTLAREILWHKYLQYLFHKQWSALKSHAAERGVSIIGDMPIYVAEDSCDVWANPHLFELDGDLRPVRVAGVPPDYFSETGQRWGNPLYDWARMKKEGYRWWKKRVARALQLYDIVRIDHFRAFEAYWAVPASEETAIDGEWVPGPGGGFFRSLQKAFGDLPFIAEDLGIITPEVEALRDDFGLPGMKILQFAFDGGPGNPYLPHNYRPECVVYTGTHDNDTTVGWFSQRGDKDRIADSIHCDAQGIHWAFIKEALASTARFAVIPMQDILGLGSEARMNTPGTDAGNWLWRLLPHQMEQADWGKLRYLIETYGRLHD